MSNSRPAETQSEPTPTSDRQQPVPRFPPGGDSGIGRATAVLFARKGASLAIHYLPAEQEEYTEGETSAA